MRLKKERFRLCIPIYHSSTSSPQTSSVSGGGFFPRQRLDSVHEAFLFVLRSSCGIASSRDRGSRMPKPSTMSRHSGLSPAMFPRAQTAWRGREGGREGGGGGEGGRERGWISEYERIYMYQESF